ncbi:ABC transporter substrate-binding protein [Lichenihabitans psoromatis]|uniref:ABC transporter substrate-binding protein n=1 Tax=Lichenihabitans psoromatis TaxID=2528642 RepID=UPI0010369F5F|nr:ABC transporter substrate-binding protein [Lichenihabitans psoromatis]
MIRRRDFFTGLALSVGVLPVPAWAQSADWEFIEARARGQSVYFNAWGGDPQTNAFLDWIAGETKARHGIDLVHVKLTDTAEAVTRVLAEKAAGRSTGGSVDLVWINGPNFVAMKDQGLLSAPFATDLPNWRYVDKRKPSNLIDFTIPVNGLESPWRIAQVVFVYDEARTPLAGLPKTASAMLDWAEAHRGRLTHPNARNFLGATFLKQALVGLVPDRDILQQAATDATFQTAAAALWSWYDALRPHLWHDGRDFPETGATLLQLFADGEIDTAISFNPAEAANGIANGTLAKSARVHVLDGGTIGNTSFVAIPYDAAHRDGAMVIANLLLAPEVQARAQDPAVLGSFTVLDLAALDPTQRAMFQKVDDRAGMPTNAQLGAPLLEPHPSWMTRITGEWERRTSQ